MDKYGAVNEKMRNFTQINKKALRSSDVYSKILSAQKEFTPKRQLRASQVAED